MAGLRIQKLKSAFNMVTIQGKVMDAEFQHLKGVKVSEINPANPLPFTATTDENGDFTLFASSMDVLIKFERDYYKPVTILAKDFYSYIMLDKPVIELISDPKKTKPFPWLNLLIGVGCAAAVGGLIMYNDPNAGKPSAPIRVKTTI